MRFHIKSSSYHHYACTMPIYNYPLKNGVFTASLFGAQQIGIVWRTSQQAWLLCPWAKHLTGCLHLYVADRWLASSVPVVNVR